MGIAISKRRLVRLLNENHQGLIAEAQNVLRAGRARGHRPGSAQTTPVRVMPARTGFARRSAMSGSAMVPHAVVEKPAELPGSAASRIRRLRAQRCGLRLHAKPRPASGYDRPPTKAGPEARVQRPDGLAQAHLDRLGFNALKVTPRLRSRVATEGALWGSVQAHEFLCDAVVSRVTMPEQFSIGQHALCWVHAERLVHKLEAFTHQHRAAQTRVRSLIWDFYADLKAYQLKPGKRAGPRRCAHASTASSFAALASPRWIACWHDYMPIRPSC